MFSINYIRFWILSGILQVLILFVGCKDNPEGKSFDTVFEIPVGAKILKSEIAITASEKAKGLMFRKSLGQDNGMIFVLGTPQQASFWMKNTEIPLDIAFIAQDGTITEIKKLYPFNLNSVKSSRNDIHFCIETNAGWFAKNNVSVGDKIDMQKLGKAIKLRSIKK